MTSELVMGVCQLTHMKLLCTVTASYLTYRALRLEAFIRASWRRTRRVQQTQTRPRKQDQEKLKEGRENPEEIRNQCRIRRNEWKEIWIAEIFAFDESFSRSVLKA